MSIWAAFGPKCQVGKVGKGGKGPVCECKGRSKWMTLPNRKLFHVFTQAVVKSKHVFWNKEVVWIWLEICIFDRAELGGFQLMWLNLEHLRQK